jgi:hypothetical protein
MGINDDKHLVSDNLWPFKANKKKQNKLISAIFHDVNDVWSGCK